MQRFLVPCLVCRDSFAGVFYQSKCPIEKHPKTKGYSKLTSLDYKKLSDEISSRDNKKDKDLMNDVDIEVRKEMDESEKLEGN